MKENEDQRSVKGSGNYMIIGSSGYSAVWLVTTGTSRYLKGGGMRGHMPWL